MKGLNHMMNKAKVTAIAVDVVTKAIEDFKKETWQYVSRIMTTMETDYHPTLKYVLKEGAFPPSRAHDTDAGIDLPCMEGFVVPGKDSRLVDTGISVQLPHNTKGVLMSRSGLNCEQCITTTGLIDEGYTGSIKVRVYNHGKFPKAFKAGDRITQLVVSPVYYPVFQEVDELDESERGDSGLGSTGR